MSPKARVLPFAFKPTKPKPAIVPAKPRGSLTIRVTVEKPKEPA